MNLAIHALGKFDAVLSNMQLTIQYIYGKCMGTSDDVHQATCITGVFVQYKNEFVSIQFRENMVDDAMLIRNSSTTKGIQLNSTGGKLYTILVMDSPTDTFKDLATKITMTLYHTKETQMGYFMAEISLSPIHYQQTQGHCNVFDYSPQLRDPNFHVLFNGDTVYWAEFYDDNNNALKIYNWTTSFTVDPSEDGFNTTTPITFSRFNSCSANTIKRSLLKRDMINQNSTNSNFTSSNANSTAKPFNKIAISMETARAQCVLCFGLQSTILDNLSHDYLMSCADDIIVSGTNMFCNSHALIATKNLLSLASLANATTPSNSNTNSTIQVSAQSQALSSFLTSMSTLNCYTGTKVSNYCICKIGTSGVDCSIIISSQIVGSNGQPIASASIGVTTSVSLMLASLMVALFI